MKLQHKRLGRCLQLQPHFIPVSGNLAGTESSMGINHLPTFADLQRRHASGMASIARFDERDHLITYLREHGAPVATAEDVYNAVLTLDDEELAAFKCCEGVAISHLSDGWWLLLCTGELFATSKDCREGADGC